MTTLTLSMVRPTTSTGRNVAYAILAWLTATVAMAVSDLPAQVPWVTPVSIAVPLSVFALLWWAHSGFRSWALSLDLNFLVLLHTWRMLGLGFVMLYFHHVLPAQFALPAGLGDAVAAVWALLLGAALYKESRVKRSAVYAWNTFGLIDFAVAVALGLLSRSSPVGLLEGPVTTDPMGNFPLNIVPLFGVPFFILTHLIIYAKLRARR